MSVFESMVMSLTTVDDGLAPKVSTNEYQNFYKEYTFDKLKGISLGEAFSKKFKINSIYINMIKNEIDVDKHIKRYYIKNDTFGN